MDDKNLLVEETSKPEKKKSGLKKKLLTVLFVIINIAIIAYTAFVEFSGGRPTGIEIEFNWVSVLFLLGAILCLAMAYFCETVKYITIMKSLDEKVSVKHAFEVAAFGKYYDSLTPSGAGGQPFQIWYLKSKGYSTGSSAAMPIAGFLSMQLGFVVLAIFVFIFNSSAIEITTIKIAAYFGLLMYLIVPLVILFFAFSPKAATKLLMVFINLFSKLKFIKNPQQKGEKILNTLNDYRDKIFIIIKRKSLILNLLMISILYQMALCSIPYFVLSAFGGDLGFIKVLSMCVFIYAAITFIPTPGNSGVAEGSFYLLFSGLETGGLFWSMLIWRLFTYYAFISIGALMYFYNAFIRGRVRKYFGQE